MLVFSSAENHEVHISQWARYRSDGLSTFVFEANKIICFTLAKCFALTACEKVSQNNEIAFFSIWQKCAQNTCEQFVTFSFKAGTLVRKSCSVTQSIFNSSLAKMQTFKNKSTTPLLKYCDFFCFQKVCPTAVGMLAWRALSTRKNRCNYFSSRPQQHS